MTDPNAFVADIHWKRSDGRVELELCAYSTDVVWLALTEMPPRDRRRILSRLVQVDGIWAVAQEADGPACFDITVPSAKFGRLPSVAIVVDNCLPEARDRIEADAELLREKGISRSRLRFSNKIDALEQTIEAAKKAIAEQTEKLEAEVRAIDPRARLIHIGADPRPYVLRCILETEIGPLVLEIKDADSFTLSSPRAMARHDSSLLREAKWKDGAWTGLPHDNDHAEVIRALGPTILSNHARDMHDAGWAKIASAKHALGLDEYALDVLMHKTLPKLLAERDAFEAETLSAPGPAMR